MSLENCNLSCAPITVVFVNAKPAQPVAYQNSLELPLKFLCYNEPQKHFWENEL